MSARDDRTMVGSSLIPRGREADTLAPGLIKVGPFDVRVRRNWGVAAPRWLFDVMTPGAGGELVRVTTYSSHPDAADCANAISQYRAGRSVARVVEEATARALAESDRFSRSPLGTPRPGKARPAPYARPSKARAR